MESWGQLHLFERTSPSSSKCLACSRCSGLQQREADGILRQKTSKQLKQLIKLSTDQETNWQPDKFLSGSLLISFHTLLCANYLLGTVSTGWEWRKPDCAGCPSGQANGCWQRLTAQLLSPRVSQQPYIWLFRPSVPVPTQTDLPAVPSDTCRPSGSTLTIYVLVFSPQFKHTYLLQSKI